MDTVNMKQARKVYRAEVKKGEAKSFRAWARRIYANDLSRGKLAQIMRNKAA